MSERTRDSNDIDTLRELQRSVGMPEVVKSYPAGYPEVHGVSVLDNLHPAAPKTTDYAENAVR